MQIRNHFVQTARWGPLGHLLARSVSAADAPSADPALLQTVPLVAVLNRLEQRGGKLTRNANGVRHRPYGSRSAVKCHLDVTSVLSPSQYENSSSIVRPSALTNQR